MKRMLPFVLITAQAFSVAALQGKTRSRLIKPHEAGKSISIVVAGKARTYHLLSAEAPTVLVVKGPGNLRLLTRARFLPDAPDQERYAVQYTVDGTAARVSQIEGVHRSKKATYKRGTLGVPGKRNDLEIALDGGYHTVMVKLEGAQQNIAARVLFTKAPTKKQKWISMAALPPDEPVELVTNETITQYYRFAENTPLKVRVVGPTQLRVLTRAEFGFHMRGNIQYRLQVRRAGEVVNTFQMNTRKSHVTSYKENGQLVPGKAREVVLEVPQGIHLYEISLLDREHCSVLGRMLIPENALALGTN